MLKDDLTRCLKDKTGKDEAGGVLPFHQESIYLKDLFLQTDHYMNLSLEELKKIVFKQNQEIEYLDQELHALEDKLIELQKTFSLKNIL